MAEWLGGGLQTRICRFDSCPWLHSRSIDMSEKSVEETFAALFALTELRQVLRDTKPTHKLTEAQKEQVRKIMEDVRKSLSLIEEDLIK